MVTPNAYRECIPSIGTGRCLVHGGIFAYGKCQTVHVLDEVRAERARQFARYGTNEVQEDGTGPRVRWLHPLSSLRAEFVEEGFRTDYAETERNGGQVTWMHLVREEVAEAFAETDPQRLREELLQVAALCVSWVEKIDAREAVND